MTQIDEINPDQKRGKPQRHNGHNGRLKQLPRYVVSVVSSWFKYISVKL